MKFIQIVAVVLVVGVIEASSVTCRFTIDNYVYNVYIDGVEKTSEVSGDLNNWGQAKSITFDSSAGTIAVFGRDAEHGCANGGFAMKCTSSDPSWNGVETDTSWKVIGNNGGTNVGTSCPSGWESPTFDDSSWKNAMLGDTTYADGVIGVPDICGEENSWCFRKQVKSSSAVDCSDVKRKNPSAQSDYYMVHPVSSGVNVRANENVEIPAAGVQVYCSFEENEAWMLVGTFKDGTADSKWAHGPYDYNNAPAPDDTSSGETLRFPFKFWNDVSQGLPKGAIRITSDVYSTNDAQYTYCPGFWKTSCTILDDKTAHDGSCFESWNTYKNGAFAGQEFSHQGGLSDGHGSIQGYTKSTRLAGAPSLVLTGFQNGAPALGKCQKSDGKYVDYKHNAGFMFWIGETYKAATLTSSEPTAEPTSEPTTSEPTAEPTAEPTHEICPVNYHSSIVENFPNTADQCNCGSDTNQVCSKNQFCYNTQCHLNAHTCNAGAHKDIFYGGKVKGSWLKENNKIEMSIKTPYDVKIKSIVWQTSSFQNIDDRTLKYDVSDSSLATKWALTSGTQTEPCKTIYALSVPTKTYFGAGSQFTLKHVAKTQDIAEKYELRSSVKVTAEQEMSYISSKGITYTYTRNVVNNLPIFVKLQTKSTITVTFKMISGKTPLSDNFVLFVGGEEGMEGSKHMVTIEMISFSANGLADVTSGGIMITQEAAKIKTGSNVFSYKSETDTDNFDREGNLVKDYITWKFEPEEVFKSTTYDITLKFKDKNSDDTWEAIAAIHIEAEDLMTEVGFETDVSLYSDQQCLHSATTFIRGAGVFAKVVLSEEIVEIESITCSKFIVKQYSNPKIDGADALVEKHMIVESDRFSFTQTKLQDSNTQDIKNTLVCGVELDSADFYVSKEGYPTELSIEVTVSYKKDKTTIRRILSVPMASNWELQNAHTFSEQAIGEAKSFAPSNDYGMENNDEVAVGSSVQDNSNESKTSDKKQGSEQLTTHFLMTEGNGLGYASETAIATENDANSEATNMGTRITFGAVFLCTAGISIYLRKIWVKSSEYTPLLD